MKYRTPYFRWTTGVTLIELLVVVVLIGLLSSIAIPAYRNMIVSSRTANLGSSLHSTMLLARSEALKRNRQIVLCKSSNADNDAATCDASASTTGNRGWAVGWILFVDDNANTNFDAGETLIRAQGALLRDPAEGAIVPNNGVELMIFNTTGQVILPVNFVVSGPTDFSALDKAVCVGIGGRARIGNAPNCA